MVRCPYDGKALVCDAEDVLAVLSGKKSGFTAHCPAGHYTTAVEITKPFVEVLGHGIGEYNFVALNVKK